MAGICRLTVSLREVTEEIGDATRIAAERARLENDIATGPAVAAVNDKMRRASEDHAFDGQETYRENTLVFLEGQPCQAISGWLLDESKREDLSPYRSQAIVRFMKDIAAINERSLERATELTQEFADDALEILNDARRQDPSDS